MSDRFYQCQDCGFADQTGKAQFKRVKLYGKISMIFCIDCVDELKERL